MLRQRRYERISVQNRRFRSSVGRLTQNFRYKGSPPTNHSSQKTRLNNLSYGIKIYTDLSSVLSQCTRLTDTETDGQTEFSLLDRVCTACSAATSRFQVIPQFFKDLHDVHFPAISMPLSPQKLERLMCCLFQSFKSWMGTVPQFPRWL